MGMVARFFGRPGSSGGWDFRRAVSIATDVWLQKAARVTVGIWSQYDTKLQQHGIA
jgi:hypothetical protein